MNNPDENTKSLKDCISMIFRVIKKIKLISSMERRGFSFYIPILVRKYLFLAEFVLVSMGEPVHSYVGSPAGLPDISME